MSCACYCTSNNSTIPSQIGFIPTSYNNTCSAFDCYTKYPQQCTEFSKISTSLVPNFPNHEGSWVETSIFGSIFFCFVVLLMLKLFSMRLGVEVGESCRNFRRVIRCDTLPLYSENCVAVPPPAYRN